MGLELGVGSSGEFSWYYETAIKELVPHFLEIDRNIDGVEVFAGVQSVVCAARTKGFKLLPFDILIAKEHDLTTTAGLKLVLESVFAIKEHGLVWLAPVCSSWVWMSRSNTKRSKDRLLFLLGIWETKGKEVTDRLI